jgi:hypothetical protein
MEGSGGVDEEDDVVAAMKAFLQAALQRQVDNIIALTYFHFFCWFGCCPFTYLLFLDVFM